MKSDTTEFSGKRVLITGGTKGAGKAMADRFHRGGATVIVTARSAPDERTDIHFIQADVSAPAGAAKVASPSVTVQPRASAALRQTCRGAVKLVGSCRVASPRHTPCSS